MRKRAALGLVLAAVLAWPAALAPFYVAAWRTGLPGSRGGPQDAFRHVLASAFAARYISPRFVDWVTAGSERGRGRHARMDRHNNRVGRDLGAQGGGPGELYRRVKAKVAAGRVNAEDPDVVTWLPESQWTSGL